MKKDDLFIICAVFIVILLFGYINVNHTRPFGIDKASAKFLRGILDQYFAKLTGFTIPKVKQEDDVEEL